MQALLVRFVLAACGLCALALVACDKESGAGLTATPAPTVSVPGQMPPLTPGGPGGVKVVSEEESLIVAEAFIKDDATFAYDGFSDSLELVDSKKLECNACWEFTYRFNSRHAGYGDRTGQVLAQVVTPHTVVIQIGEAEVRFARMDSATDMLKHE